MDIFGIDFYNNWFKNIYKFVIENIYGVFKYGECAIIRIVWDMGGFKVVLFDYFRFVVTNIDYFCYAVTNVGADKL